MALQMIRKDNPRLFETYIVCDDRLYDYHPQTKEVWIRAVPSIQLDAVPIPFLWRQLTINALFHLQIEFQLRTLDQLGQFDLKLTKDISAKHPDYIYIEIRPRTDSDKYYFKTAQLVLLADRYLTRRLWIEYGNGDEITWDITEMDTTTKLKRADFAPPIPKDWNVRSLELPKANSNPPRLVPKTLKEK
jgi:hypothetical protein